MQKSSGKYEVTRIEQLAFVLRQVSHSRGWSSMAKHERGKGDRNGALPVPINGLHGLERRRARVRVGKTVA